MERRSVTGSTSDTSRPFTRIHPASGSTRRLTMRKVVDLPQPEGPISAQVVPSGTARSTPLTAGRATPG